ncbi:DUF6192 family protein [Nonomuraea dietziae]|uniref:DUF6192 family protein n=1 Tax=Nonomuraea dietziae TaxID=65515 RepID=UPI00343E31F3
MVHAGIIGASWPRSRHHSSHGAHVDEAWTVKASLEQFADDIGISYSALKNWRWTASRWPQRHRQDGVSHTVHRILASIRDETLRWRKIKEPPEDPRTGQHRWTVDTANREVGRSVDSPFTVSEKIEAVNDLVVDEQVAAKVATTLLHRPEVAFKAMADQTAKQMVNRAQIDHATQAIEQHLEPAAPALRQLQRSMEFIDLIAACAQFTATVERTMAKLAGHDFTDDERDAVRERLQRVRAAADWIEQAIETGNLTLEEGLAALLRGEGGHDGPREP